MKKTLLFTTTASLCALTATAQEVSSGEALAASLRKTPAATLSRVGISYRAAFNVNVRFQNLGGLAPAPLDSRIPGQVAPGTTTGFQENHVYEDGYNLLDDNLNDYGGLHATRNWGYLSDSQALDTPDGQFVAMHATSAAATASTGGLDDDPLHGFEINYSRELQDRGAWKWGVAAAFDFMHFGVSDGRPLTGDVNQLTDLFAVPEGGFVPDAPYYGSNSEGPLLGSEPGRTESIFADASTITGSRHFGADLFGLRMGPYIEIPIFEKLSLNLSGGLALLFVSSDLSYTAETVTISAAVDPSGLLTQTHPAGSSSKSDLLPGGYLDAKLYWMLNDNWAVSGGLELRGAGRYTHQDPASGKAAALDLRETLAGTLGISYSF